jgi:hypothetical protein
MNEEKSIKILLIKKDDKTFTVETHTNDVNVIEILAMLELAKRDVSKYIEKNENI